MPQHIRASGSGLDWPSYGFDLANTRHVDLNQISGANVASLVPEWRFDFGFHGRLETSPVVVGGTMYVTSGPVNEVVALDAASGALKWRYEPAVGSSAPCCGLVNRGVAVAGKRVFFASIDGRLHALDARSGRALWDVAVGDPRTGFSETMAPLAWHDLVFIGSSGGEFGVRGSLSAYGQADGRLRWRWWTVGPGWEGNYTASVHGVSLHRNIAREKADAPKYRRSWMHGGGPIWMTPALDPATGVIYAGTGDPAASYNGSQRPGDNWYTDSIVALDALTGKMKWFYQETPHDVWDYDAGSPPVLFNARSGWRRVPAVGEAGKTGWLYVVDRRSGRPIRVSQAFVPQVNMYERPRMSGYVTIRPGSEGGNMAPIAFDPNLHLAFIAAVDRPDVYRVEGFTPWQPGAGQWLTGESHAVGFFTQFVCAVNVDTGRLVWRRATVGGRLEQPAEVILGGVLSSGELVFAASPDGKLFAFDGPTGRVMWKYDFGTPDAARVNQSWLERLKNFLLPLKHWLFREPAPVYTAHIDAPPISYEINGRQYVAIAVDISPQLGTGSDAIVVFALPR